MIDIQAFADRNLGKVVDDGAGNYKGECVSLVKRWVKDNGWPYRRGNAINWQYNAGNGYTWYRNYVWSVPKTGDMIVFQVGSLGHIGIVMPGANGRNVPVLNQNWPTGDDHDPVRITNFNYLRPKCIGWLRHN